MQHGVFLFVWVISVLSYNIKLVSTVSCQGRAWKQTTHANFFNMQDVCQYPAQNMFLKDSLQCIKRIFMDWQFKQRKHVSEYKNVAFAQKKKQQQLTPHIHR